MSPSEALLTSPHLTGPFTILINLSVQEMRLLVHLASKPGKMHTRRDLLTAVWDYRPEAVSRTLDTHVMRLRDKFGTFATMIQTVHGVGHRLNDRIPSRTHMDAV